MAASLTSTSAHCDRRPHLAGSVVGRSDLSAADRDQMYELLQTYFSHSDHAQFERDLIEKDTVILLRDATTHRIQGFSTLLRLHMDVDGQTVAAFFSGDTIIDRAYWGETMLSRLWAQTVFADVDRITAELPETEVYWFLICSGYKTWRFLPLFFRQFYPNAKGPTPPRDQRILDALATRKFGDQYKAELGIVRLHAASPLRRGVAELTDERLRDSDVAFFAQMNPGHHDGDELACLASLSRSNLTRAAQRMIARPVV